MQKEENEKVDSKRIDIQPHAKVRSRRARQLAEERAKTRFDYSTNFEFECLLVLIIF